MKKLFGIILCLSIIGFTAASCNGKEEDCSATASNLQGLSTSMADAAIAYGTNPNAANCNAYKNAVQAYIDEAQGLVDCPGLSSTEKAQYQQALDTAEANLAALVC
ncbi:MAG: hypothetical protein IPL33_01245 [Sphingobacteriales bacterium]|nr:hypothetical protein [Sphingobacteriales bacterium]MCC7224597.1 hypothetical protein [Chitinophagales bacterium]